MYVAIADEERNSLGPNATHPGRLSLWPTAAVLALITFALPAGRAYAYPYPDCHAAIYDNWTTCEPTDYRWPPPQPLIFWATCIICDDTPDAGPTPLCDTDNELVTDQQSLDNLSIQVESTWETVPGNFTLLSETCDGKKLISFDGTLEPDTEYQFKWKAYPFSLSGFSFHTIKKDSGAQEEDSGAKKKDSGAKKKDGGAKVTDSGVDSTNYPPPSKPDESSCSVGGGADSWPGSAILLWGLLLCLARVRRRS